MTAETFVAWLSGFFELAGADKADETKMRISSAQVEILKRKLQAVNGTNVATTIVPYAVNRVTEPNQKFDF